MEGNKALYGEVADFLEAQGFQRNVGPHDIDRFTLTPSETKTVEIDREAKTAIATISTKAKDRHGDIIDPRGASLVHFRANPVVLFAHDYGAMPIGKSLWEKQTQDSITAKVRFHCTTELSREVWALVKAKVLNAWSIGFLPMKWQPIVGRAGHTHAGGFHVTAWDLLEYSSVPVGANPDALTNALEGLGFADSCMMVKVLKGQHAVDTRDDTVAGGGVGSAERANRGIPPHPAPSPVAPTPIPHCRPAEIAKAVRTAMDRALLALKGGDPCD